MEDSGIGLLLLNHPRRGDGLRVGVLGLGVGTLATYAQAGDVYRMYDSSARSCSLITENRAENQPGA